MNARPDHSRNACLFVSPPGRSFILLSAAAFSFIRRDIRHGDVYQVLRRKPKL